MDGSRQGIIDAIEHEADLKKKYLNSQIGCLDKGFVRLVDFMGSDASVVQAARVSTNKGTTDKKRDEMLIRYLMRMRHTSPFEQVEFKFHCKLPIFCARQMVRHRTASLNEMSGRYSQMPEEYYIPEIDRLRTQDKVNLQGSGEEQIEEATWIQDSFKDECKLSFENYNSYLKCGLAREIARINLPLSTYTQWYWKMDLHNLFHFLALRLHPHAQYEMRQYAKAIFALIQPIVPVSCQAFAEYKLNARTFSGKEMNIIKGLLNKIHPNDISTMLCDSGLSKQEQEELLDKIT